jgi:hypothetical protein
VEDFKRMPSGSKMRNRFDKAWGWVFLSWWILHFVRRRIH